MTRSVQARPTSGNEQIGGTEEQREAIGGVWNEDARKMATRMKCT